jgi:hypothetical protein
MSQVSCMPCVGSQPLANFDSSSVMKSRVKALSACEVRLATHVGSPKLKRAQKRTAQLKEERQ